MAIGDPVLGSELGPEFDTANNPVTIKVDGVTVTKNGADELEAPQPTLGYNNATTALTFTAPGQTPTVIDLSALTTDIFVNGGSYNATTMALTLNDNNGGTVVVNLAALLGVSTDAGQLLVNGSDGKPLFTKADLDAETFVLTSLFGTPIGRMVNL